MKRFLGLLSLALLAFAPLPQTDFTGITLSTPFPSQTVPPGVSYSLPLTVQSFNLGPQTVSLSVADVPEGWQVHFIGSGKVVSSVFLGPDAIETLSLKLTPPAGVEFGDYPIRLQAAGDLATAELSIVLTIGEVFPPEIRLEVDLPTLRGSPTSPFNFRGTLRNESDQDMVVTLEAAPPEGFEVRFRLSVGNQEVTSFPLKANDSETLTIEVRAPDTATAGEYPITVTAAAEEVSTELNLTAIVTGTPELTLTTPDGRLSGRVYSGRETPLKIVIRNNGTAEAQSVALDANEPARWRVTFAPEEIDLLAPGAEQEVTVNITPADKAVAGDYMITLSATPDNGSRDSADFRVTLLTSTLWGVVGLVLIAAALGVVALAVSRFGRR